MYLNSDMKLVMYEVDDIEVIQEKGIDSVTLVQGDNAIVVNSESLEKFREALSDVDTIFYERKKNENKVIVNTLGSTPE